MDDKKRYPIGQQYFKTLRKDDAFYIDKTAFVEKIAKNKSKYYFLARPRRFGKSLFLSTLRFFFEGQRDLFKGLYNLRIETSKFIYIIELKYDSTPEEAIRQIEDMEYARKFSIDQRKLFKIGVNFSSEKRRIDYWKIES
ncbi:MAG: ATP-binding protein [Muribaculaceae bacterium]|nr:ATP-binding protein [Muribaculaceae bacterium]